MLQYLSRFATVDLLSLVHDEDEVRQAANRLPAEHVTIVRTTPWRNRLRAAVRLGSSQPLTHLLLDSPGLEPAVKQLAATCRPDVILSYCTGVAPVALMDHFKTVPLVLDMVDVDSAKWRALSRSSTPPLSWVYAREARCLGRFEARIVAHARTTIVVNERERETLAQAAPAADVRVVENGVDFDLFHAAGPPAVDPRVVFCGVMNYQPNEEAALRLIRDVWPRVRAERPDARLVIVGAHPTNRLVQAAAQDRSVEVTGSVPDVRPYLWGAAVSVAPLTIARGLQNKVLEALAAGLPVVTTPAVSAGLPPAVAAGCIVTGDDEAGAILSLLGRAPHERRAFAQQANLTDLRWDRQLAPLLPILSAAARRQPFIRLAS